MEGSIPQPSNSNQTASGASKFLANLPSRGHLSSTVLSSNPGGMRVYICCHGTSPPEGQHIKTNQQNILIRSLTLRNKKSDSSLKNGKGSGVAESSRKRTAERTMDSRASVKRANSQSSSKQEGSTSEGSSRDFQGLTVERLRVLLKGKGLSLKGKKDELIARLRSASD